MSKVTIVPASEMWKNNAIIMLRNGHTVAELQAILARAVDKVNEERQQEADRLAAWNRVPEDQRPAL